MLGHTWKLAYSVSVGEKIIRVNDYARESVGLYDRQQREPRLID